MNGKADFSWISVLVLLCGCGGGGDGGGGGNPPPPPPPPPPPTATYSLVHAFTDGTEGRNPYDGVIGDSAGNLYGTTWACGDPQPCGGYGTVFMVDPSGNLLTLHTFAGAPTDGDGVSGPLTRDAAGNLYGTTLYGGNAGFGTVFKLDAAGNETVLHHFTGGEGGDGPAGGVLLDVQGNLYGGTTGGGLGDSGTVFRLEPDGTFTTLHRFAADGSEGTAPLGLVQDAAGNLYGVTPSGGADSDSGSGSGGGTVFRIDSAGVFTTLHDFATNSVASHPIGPLMRDDAGNLYGVTFYRVTERYGAEDGGTIFRLDPEGEISFLHEFESSDPSGAPLYGSNSPGGSYPYAGLVGDPTGIVYGTTSTGGTPRRGVVYQFDLESRAFTVLHTFTDGQQGGFVQAPLLLDSAGDLYGTTGNGGDLTCNPPGGGCGTVFRIDLE